MLLQSSLWSPSPSSWSVPVVRDVAGGGPVGGDRPGSDAGAAAGAVVLVASPVADLVDFPVVALASFPVVVLADPVADSLVVAADSPVVVAAVVANG